MAEGPKKEYERFNIHQRIQHVMMFTSFMVCTFTGLPIKYAYTGWGSRLAALFGGADTDLKIHLTGAAVMLASCVYHLFWLIYMLSRKKTRSWATLPGPKDFKDLADNLAYLLGLSKKQANWERYTYKEKFDYWAVFWGIFMIGGSGLMMWFPDVATKYVPRWFIDASRAAHSDEAVLAIVVIFFWHFYNVHFSPTFFPMNKLWYTGKMSRELMLHEHPAELARLEGGTVAQVDSFKVNTTALDSLDGIPGEKISHKS
ncbi:MAG: cytochrome b/b6 domain-containing protein [Peptococcaceae bacterium]|nr:cytochrome b/b6 domain-containing protein [Peptococcaceae bacterium]